MELQLSFTQIALLDKAVDRRAVVLRRLSWHTSGFIITAGDVKLCALLMVRFLLFQ